MKEVLLISSITFREALRRKVWIWLIIIFVGIGICDWVSTMTSEHTMIPMRVDPRVLVAQILSRGILLFFTSIIAVVLAAGQITGELERGVLATILPKPVSRFQVFFGKWLGVLAFADSVVLFCYSANFVVLGIMFGSGSGLGWHWSALGVMMLYPMLYGTLTMAWSSFGNMVVALLLTATLYAVTWIGDLIVTAIAKITENHTLERMQVLSTWIIPHARLSTWLSTTDRDFFSYIPKGFGMPITADTVDKLYILGYMGAFFAFAYLIFSKRDVQ